MRVGKVSIARRCPVPTVPEEFTDQRKIFSGHDGQAGSCKVNVVQVDLAERGVLADSVAAAPLRPFLNFQSKVKECASLIRH